MRDKLQRVRVKPLHEQRHLHRHDQRVRLLLCAWLLRAALRARRSRLQLLRGGQVLQRGAVHRRARVQVLLQVYGR